MEPLHKAWTQEQPLRFAFPAGYDRLLEQLASEHLHPYDIQSSVAAEQDGFWLLLRFGEGWKQERRHFWTREKLEYGSDEMNDFFKEAAQACKKALVADYFKMMKP